MDAKKFGNFIAQARREQKLTQAQLAQRLHVTDKAVSRWERGLGFPDIGTIEPLALILGLSVVELIKSERILDSQISCSDASDLLKEAFTLMNEQEKLTLKKMDDQNVVKQQYATADALRGRISLHDRYSTNKFGWFNWLYAQYNFKPGCRILELGCGDGRFWAEHFDKLPEGVSLTLSDVSGKMLETARQMVGHENEITYRVIDAQDIPLPDGSVDIVIANMMLYHLPDLSRALIEIRRVMQDDGVFYCATGGENGIDNYIRHALHLPRGEKLKFTLQNGEEILHTNFSQVEKRLYEDSLAITDTSDLVAYARTLPWIAEQPQLRTSLSSQVIYSALEAKKENGVIRIPKEYGTFIARK